MPNPSPSPLAPSAARPRPSPLDLANTVVRNLVPLAGILFLGWSAGTTLVLYFIDTMLAMTVLFAGLARYFAPKTPDGDAASGIGADAGATMAALFISAFVAVPLGLPLLFVGVAADLDWHAIFADSAFRMGVAVQAIAAFWSGASLYRALTTRTPEDLRLKQRFALVMLRWIALLMVVYTGAAFLFGRFAPLVLVAVYAGVSTAIDIAPQRVLAFAPNAKDLSEDESPNDKDRRRRKRESSRR